MEISEIRIRKSDTEVGIGVEINTLNKKGESVTDVVADMLFEADIGFSEWLAIENMEEIEKVIKEL